LKNESPNTALAVGTIVDSRRVSGLLWSPGGQASACAVDALATLSPPEGNERYQYVGELADWAVEDFAGHCRGLGIDLPAPLAAGHQVFVKQQPDGIKVYVPALALMQAFFWPRTDVFPAAFTSLNVDLFAYVGDRDGTPMVQMLDGPQFSAAFQRSGGVDRHLRWLHGSKSARNCAQSVELHALQGRLGMDLPLGKFEIKLFGRRVGKAFHAVKAHVVGVEVPADDNISDQEEVFHLHRCQVGKLAQSLQQVNAAITTEEWGAVRHLVNGRTFMDAEKLTHLLNRLANGYWLRAEPGLVKLVSQSLHKLAQEFSPGKRVDGVTRAVDTLMVIREGVFAKAEGTIQAPNKAELELVGPVKSKDKPIQVFLKVDYEDREAEVAFQSIALVAEGDEIQGKWAPQAASLDAAGYPQQAILTGSADEDRHSVLAIAKHVQSWLNRLRSGVVVVHHRSIVEFRLLQRLLALHPGKMNTELEQLDVSSLLQDSRGAAVWESSRAEQLANEDDDVTEALAEAKALSGFAREMHAQIAALPKEAPRRKAIPEPRAGIAVTPWVQRSIELHAKRQKRAAAPTDGANVVAGGLKGGAAVTSRPAPPDIS